MQRRREGDPREALITGHAQQVEGGAPLQSTASSEIPHEEATRERAPRKETPAAIVAPRPDARSDLLAALDSRQALRRAIVLQEVLGPPKALQP